MSEEKDRAAFYERYKDDPDMWGEPEKTTPSVRRGGLSATITVRFSPEEASAIRGLAKELGVSYSDVVRRAVRKFVHSRLTTGEAAETEERRDLSFSNATTSTGSSHS